MASKLTSKHADAMLRNDLMTFVQRCFRELYPQKRFCPSPHLALLAAELMNCMNGKTKRLIINLPPRSLKSFLVSAAFPAFVLGRDPTKQIIGASYGQILAIKHARDTKAIMESPFYRRIFPKTRILAERRAVNDFMTTKQGFRMATSVGGPLTGRGGDLLIIDDPLKPIEAISDTSRDAVNDWAANTLLSRLNDQHQGVIIVVMQRLHQDDLSGYFIGKGGWKVISLPAIAVVEENFRIENRLSPKTHFRRHVGEVLDPNRQSLASVLDMKQNTSSYIFDAQWQQDPAPVGGAIIKVDWLRYYESLIALPRFTYVLQSWDTANKSGELNDYSVCTTWGVYKGQYYLLDVYRERLDFPNLKRKVIELHKKYKPTKIIIEDKASGTQLLQELASELGYNLKPYIAPPQADKIMRLYSQTIAFEEGNVFLPTSAPWLAEYRKELTTFPGTKFDDQVDSTTQALDYIRQHNEAEIWARLGRK